MEIKTLDYKAWEINPTEFSTSLGMCFIETGFFLLKNHPIPDKLLSYNKLLFNNFFKHLSVAERMQYSFKELDYSKGYTPMRIETGEHAKNADEKHYYHVVEPFSENPNVAEILELKKMSERLFDEFNQLYKSLMQATALSLNLKRCHFNTELGNSVLRFIHYPANSIVVSDDEAVTLGGNAAGMCASKHTDINHITLLHATEPGLQLWMDGKWKPVQCGPELIIVNAGDMLQHLTAGFYKSGLHRVVCEPDKERFSCPFFGHRNPEHSVEPLPQFKGYDQSLYPFKEVGKYLDYRLKQLKLKK